MKGRSFFQPRWPRLPCLAAAHSPAPTIESPVLSTTRWMGPGGGGTRPRGADSAERGWCGRGPRDRHSSRTAPTAGSPPPGEAATRRRAAASTRSRSRDPRTCAVRLVDRTARVSMRRSRLRRARTSRRLAGRAHARTPANSRRGIWFCTSGALASSCRDRARSAVPTARNLDSARQRSRIRAPTPWRASTWWIVWRTVVVPPTKTAKVSRRRPRSSARDRTINKVKTLGRRQWKKVSGYHQQARGENAFFRYKSIIGSGLRARAPGGREAEALLACNVLNRMTELGKSQSYRVGP